jgi:hypothetical protein
LFHSRKEQNNSKASAFKKPIRITNNAQKKYFQIKQAIQIKRCRPSQNKLPQLAGKKQLPHFAKQPIQSSFLKNIIVFYPLFLKNRY